MWLRASTDSGVLEHAHPSHCAIGGMARGRLPLVGVLVPAIAAVLLAACGTAPTKPTEASSEPAPAAAGKQGAAAGAAVVPVAVTARGKADFERAVGFMRSGNNTEAELEFKQVALQFPQLSAPYVNLGILYRKTGRLDQSEAALKTAVERNDGSAVAWTELGATQRLRGEFPAAAASYEKAITDDPNFAPAYRNLGVVTDLYLGDPERALTAFEKYKELTGEEKPVSGWIAELRVRTGKPPLKRPSAAPAAGASDATPPADSGTGAGGASGAPAGAPAGNGAPQSAPGQGQKPADSRGAPPAAAPPPKAGE
jgi:Tfp pilus assembly protein PilF